MRKNRFLGLRFLFFVLSTLWLAQPLVLGQLTTGGMVGTVTDSSGAVVPGVAVTLTDVSTGVATKTTTDSDGNYTVRPLLIGTYTVTAEKQGFQQAVLSNVEVAIGQVVRLDLVLQLGTVEQKLQVTAAPPLLQSQTSSLGTIETERRIADLPLNGRNFFQLAYLGPGASLGANGTSAAVGATDNNRPGIAVSVNGLRVFDNNFLIDGVDNNEFGNGTVIVQPPPDAIQEFRVEENSMNAEFGRGGAMLNLVLKSGSNQLHASAWEFLRNDKLDARNFFDVKRPPFKRNQYGASAGAPIKKDKMFIFGDFQRTNVRKGLTALSTVPTAKMRTGDFSEVGAVLYDPSKTVAGARPLLNPANPSVIPPGDINPVGQNIVNLFPMPNLSGTTNNFVFNPKQFFDETTAEVRYDYQISDRDHFFSHYAIGTPDSNNPSVLPNVDGGAASGIASTLGVRLQSSAAGWTHTFSPTLLNDLHGGYFRFRDTTLPIDFGQTPGTQLGIPNANRGTPFTTGLPKMNIAGFQQLGDSLWVPETIVENVFQLADTVTSIRGKHTLKFGADFRRQQRNFFQQTAPRGWYTFSGLYTANPATSSGGNALADTLLGIPQTRFQDNLNGIDPTRYWDLAEFVQDDVRMTPNLTLNLGLRYEISSPAGGRVGNFDLQRAIVVTATGANGVPHAGVDFDLRDWAPRLGFAWTARPKTVVRGGVGRFYAPEGNIFDDLGLNPPALVVNSRNFNGSQAPIAGQSVSAGFLPTFPTVDLNNPIGTVRTTGTVRKIPAILEWNFTVQRQFGEDWLVQAAYVGNRGIRLFDHESGNYNQPLLPLDSNFSDTATGNMGRPYFNQRPGLTIILPLDIGRLSMVYHSFQVSATKRFSNGFNLLAAYTLAKSLGTADGNVSQCDIQNAHDVSAEKGPVTPDFRHRLSVSYLYELPYGRGRRFGSGASGIADKILGGWEAGGITTLQSGEAFNAETSFDPSNTGSTNPRPNRLHNPEDFSFNTAQQTALGCSKPGQQTLDCFFNQGAFAIAPFAPGQIFAHLFGNAGRAVLRGPELVNFDFSIFKRFRLTEKQNLEFKVELFNIFNTPNFNLPNLGSGGGSSGVGFIDVSGGAAVSSTLPDNQREIQFALKYSF